MGLIILIKEEEKKSSKLDQEVESSLLIDMVISWGKSDSLSARLDYSGIS